MKKVIYSALFCAFLASCGGGEEEKKEPETFDDMKKAVCDCMQSKSGQDRMECMKMQHDYSEKQKSEEDRVKFIQETNECMD